LHLGNSNIGKTIGRIDKATLINLAKYPKEYMTPKRGPSGNSPHNSRSAGDLLS
jgi:hypothetical protein